MKTHAPPVMLSKPIVAVVHVVRISIVLPQYFVQYQFRVDFNLGVCIDGAAKE